MAGHQSLGAPPGKVQSLVVGYNKNQQRRPTTTTATSFGFFLFTSPFLSFISILHLLHPPPLGRPGCVSSIPPCTSAAHSHSLNTPTTPFQVVVIVYRIIVLHTPAPIITFIRYVRGQISPRVPGALPRLLGLRTPCSSRDPAQARTCPRARDR